MSILPELEVNGETAMVSLYYPRNEGQVKQVEIDLIDVRAADSIRVLYDFGRDGWSIQQASIFQRGPEDTGMDSDWQEVAFIKAWARKKEPECA